MSENRPPGGGGTGAIPGRNLRIADATAIALRCLRYPPVSQTGQESAKPLMRLIKSYFCALFYSAAECCLDALEIGRKYRGGHSWT